jgi:DNA modification methylase
MENGKNPGDVFSINTYPFPDAHFAVFPPELVEKPILSGTKKNDIVLDPFAGSGTTLMVARRLNRRFIGIEINKEFIEMANGRVIGRLFATGD